MLKQYKYHALTILLAVMLLSFLTTTTFAATKKLSIDRVEQAKSKWCWAATGEMIGQYLNSNSTRDQWDIVEQFKGWPWDPYPNSGATDSEVAKAIEFASMAMVNYSYDGNVKSFSFHQSDIDDSYPILVQMEWESGGKHAVVCAGYKTGTKDSLYLIDPWWDCGSAYYSYSDLKSGIQIHQEKANILTHTTTINQIIYLAPTNKYEEVGIL